MTASRKYTYKEVVGLAWLRSQLVQVQALPQRQVALYAKVMLTGVDCCKEISPIFRDAEPFPVSAKFICATGSLYHINQRFPVFGYRCRVFDSSVVSENSVLSGPQLASAATMAALS